MKTIRASVLIAALLCTGAAHAQRVVIVNGERLTPTQLAWLEHFNCTPVPNGSYWLNLQTGAWSYAGTVQRQGFVGDACRNTRHRSLSERDRLFRPGEIINGR